MDDLSGIYGKQLDDVFDAYQEAMNRSSWILSAEIKINPRDLNLSPTKLNEPIRCYWPNRHFYPLPSRLYVPTNMIRRLWYLGWDKAIVGAGRWTYKIPDPFYDDDLPWMFWHTIPRAMAGRTIRYEPGSDEDCGYVYRVTNDIIKRDHNADMQLIEWMD